MRSIILIVFCSVFVNETSCFNLSGGLAIGLATISEFVNTILEQNKNGSLLKEECAAQLSAFTENLNSIPTTDDEAWAIKMIDASAKPPAGLIDINMQWLGSYDECLSIDSKAKYVNVTGKYCLATVALQSIVQSQASTIKTDYTLVLEADPRVIRLGAGTPGAEVTLKLSNKKVPLVQTLFKDLKGVQRAENLDFKLPFYPSVAICVPDKCQHNEVHNVLKLLNASIPFDVFCQTKDDLYKPLDTGAILTICYFAAFVLLLLVSTAYDMFRNDKIEPYLLLMAFSLKRNCTRLATIKKDGSEFSCLYGLKFLSMVWVLFGHVLATTTMGPVVNTAEIFKTLDTTGSMIFANAVHSVDTFFVIGGFLVVHGFMKAKHQGSKFNAKYFAHFYFHRYLRLAFPFLPVVLACSFLVKYLGSGPFYPEIEAYVVQPCKDRWWSALLYIQNFDTKNIMCVEQTWYSNIDWQLYVISPLFLLWLPKYPKVGLGIMLCGALGAMAASYIVTWNYQLQSMQSNLYQNVSDFNAYYYYKTWTRGGTWLIGGILGYIMAKIKLNDKNTQLGIPKWLFIIIWLTVLTVMPVCIFVGHDALTRADYHPYSNAFYNAFTRTTWGLCVAWIIFACSVGFGGVINTFLSLPFFQIMSRFTYSMYLLHLQLLYLRIWSLKQQQYFSMYNLISEFWSIFALTLSLSIFWVLAFESPIPGLEKFIIKKCNTIFNKKEETTQVESNNSGSSSANNMRLQPQISVEGP